MSNAIAQSATSLTVSTTGGEDNFPFAERIETLAQKQAKGMTREKVLINKQKLTSQVCADYRAHFANLYGKTERLPSEIFEKIEKAVDTFIERNLKLVNPFNAQSVRRAFAVKFNDLMIVERVTAIGENTLSLKEQKFGIEIALGQANKRLDDLQAKKTPDYDREKELRAQIMKLTLVKDFILGELKHQEKLAAEANTEAKSS